ncbi:MAG TPA: VOC family protein [Vicinamibacterales bacterium]|nr:VOC family protein [Vicinamibacterales bacterium]
MSVDGKNLFTGIDTRITRRGLLLALPAVAMARRVLTAQGSAGTLKIRAFNHMTLSVSDPKRSLDFYQGLFGMPVHAHQGATTLLRVGDGPQFIAISPAGSNPVGINHYCLTIDDFNVDRVLKVLADHGITKAEGTGGGLTGGPLKVRVRLRGPESGGAPGGTPEIYVGDPDGIAVQLQDPRYCGGSGVLGDVCAPEPAPKPGLLKLREYNHFTVSATDAKRSNQFYKDVFGTGIRSYQGPTAPTNAIGPTVAFLMYTGGGAPTTPPRQASINHACLNMENFNPDTVIKALESYGIKPRESQTGPAGPLRHYISMRMENRGGAKEGTPELYFTDPDGILLQLQDVKYCGGGGYLGDACPPVA